MNSPSLVLTLRSHRHEPATSSIQEEQESTRCESRIPGRSWTLATVLACMACALLLTGCLNLKPAPDSTRNFLLTAVDHANGSTNAAGLSVGLAPVRLPAHTSSSWIAIRTGPNELQYSETARWAEPLDRNVQRILGENLRQQPGIGAVLLNTWPSSAVQREVSIQIDPIDLDASGTIVLGAQWTIGSPQGSAIISTHTARVTRPGPRPAEDIAGAVAALSEALADLSHRIAESLLKP